jgi:AsnC-like helix-turn-helix protein
MTAPRGVSRFVSVTDRDQAEPVITGERPSLPAEPAGCVSPVRPRVPVITRHRRPRLAEAVQAIPTTQAIARVRLDPGLGCDEFERRLRIIPAARSAVSVAGDVDYEIWLACADLADLDAVVACLRSWRGVAIASIALVLHEVQGLGQQEHALPDWGALPRSHAV